MSNTRTIAALLKQATIELSPLHDSARLDAEVLLAFTLERDRSYLSAWPEKILSSQDQQKFLELVRARKSGTPIAYLTGQREFWSLNLKVTKDTLIPRPETELLVETALTRLPQGKPLTVLDMGTGTGAIALAIARERPLADIVATDNRLAPLWVARSNSLALELTNIDFVCSQWCNGLPQHFFDLIVSNPPYIAVRDPHLMLGDVRFEPVSALESGIDGLTDIRAICTQARDHLKPGGTLILEHGFQQREQVLAILSANKFRNLDSHSDLAGNPRVCIGQR